MNYHRKLVLTCLVSFLLLNDLSWGNSLPRPPKRFSLSDCPGLLIELAKRTFFKASPGSDLTPIEVSPEHFDSLMEAFRSGVEPDFNDPDERAAFDVYRRLFMGNPNTSLLPDTYEQMAAVQKKNPKLAKKPFRNIEVRSQRLNYPKTEAIKKVVALRKNAAGSVRANLLRARENRGFWKGLGKGAAIH